MRLSQLMSAEVTRFLYQYGSGSGWDHDILIEKILPRGDGEKYPFCRDGKRACPPEDCKGPSGYRKFLKTLNGSSGPADSNGHERVDQDFDAEKFVAAEINQRLGWS